MIIRVAWAPILMAFVLLGVTSVGTMAAIIIGAIVLVAAALRERLARRPLL